METEVQLKPGIDVTMEIVTPEGKPVPGAKVGLSLRATSSYGFGLGERRTGGDGKAVARALNPDWPSELEVAIEPMHDFQAMRTKMPITPGPHRITLKKGFAFEGTVLDAEGKPVPNVKLRFVSEDYGLQIPWIYAWSNAEGKFAVSTLSASTYSLYFDECYPVGTTFSRKDAGRYSIQHAAGGNPKVKIPEEKRGEYRVVAAPWKR